MLIKCADVSNPMRPVVMCKEWAYRIAEEYCEQVSITGKTKIKSNQIKSFILSLVQQIYTIVHEGETHTHSITNKLHTEQRGFPKSRAYHAGI